MVERPALMNEDAVEVIRSEESLVVGSSIRESGRVRISKRIVTEERTITVTVRREELVVTDLPPEPGTADLDLTGLTGPDGRLLDLTEAPVVDLVLSEERVMTTTVVVPVERVLVHLKRVTTRTDVGADVAREVVTTQTSDTRPTADRTAKDQP